MPYKSKSINFGEDKQVLDIEKVRDYVENISLVLDLKWQPVGVTLIDEAEELDSLNIPLIKGKASYCQMIKRACSGKGSKSILQNHSCDGGTTALAMEKSTGRIESGEEYYSYNLFNSKSAARRMRQNIVSLPWDSVETYGVVTAPLSDSVTIPDVIVIVCKPYETMRLIQGYEYATGKKPNVDMGAMQALCSELTAKPIIRGEMNVSVFCPSTRMLCKWRDDEMGVGLPFEDFYRTVDGVFGTMNTTDNRKKKEAAIERFAKAGKKFDIDLKMGY